MGGNVKRRKGVEPKVEEPEEVESSNEEGAESSNEEEEIESNDEGVEERVGSESGKELCDKGKIDLHMIA